MSDELWKKQAALFGHVVKHLEACCVEAKARQAELYPDARTPSGAGCAAMGAMMIACAWSIGSTFASNSLSHEESDAFFDETLRECKERFRDGFSRPGEGVMF